MDRYDTQCASWRKSSYSTSTGQNCVEVAALPDAIGVRDSKRPAEGHLAVPPAVWTAFLGRLRLR